MTVCLPPRIGFTLALLLGSSLGFGAAPASISRERALGVLVGRIDVVLSGRDFSKEEIGRFRKTTRKLARKMGSRILPKKLEAGSQEALEHILTTGAPISCTDPEYVQLALEEYFRVIGAYCKRSVRTPPLETETREKVRRTIADITDKVEDQMQNHLGKWFSKEDLAKEARRARGVWERKIGDPRTSAFKRPLDARQTEHLLAEFNTRLVESVPRIQERLASASASGPNVSPSRKAEKEKLVKRLILREITRRLAWVLGKRTTDPERPVISLTQIDPALQKVSMRRSRLEGEIYRRRSQRQREERRKDKARRQQAKWERMADLVIDPKIAKMGEEPLALSTPDADPGEREKTARTFSPSTPGPPAESATGFWGNRASVWIAAAVVGAAVVLVIAVVARRRDRRIPD